MNKSIESSSMHIAGTRRNGSAKSAKSSSGSGAEHEIKRHPYPPTAYTPESFSADATRYTAGEFCTGSVDFADRFYRFALSHGFEIGAVRETGDRPAYFKIDAKDHKKSGRYFFKIDPDGLGAIGTIINHKTGERITYHESLRHGIPTPAKTPIYQHDSVNNVVESGSPAPIEKQNEDAVMARKKAEWIAIYENAKVATEHSYCTKKGVQAQHEGSPLPLKITNDGILLIPSVGADGKIVGAQRIYPAPEHRKLTTPGGGGGHHVIGQIDAEGTVYIAEGFATAASIYEAIGIACIVSFGTSNMHRAARDARKLYGVKRFVFCADNDESKTGLKAAMKAASENPGSLIAIPNVLGDFNDLALAQGLDAVRKSIEDARDPALDIFPKPLPLPALPAVPSLTPDMMPRLLREWAAHEQLARGMPAIETLVVPTIAGASSLVAACFVMQPTSDPGYIVSPNLSGLICADPGSMKSPGHAFIVGLLSSIQARRTKQDKLKIEEGKTRMDIYKKKIRLLEQMRNAMVKEGASAEDILAAEKEFKASHNIVKPNISDYRAYLFEDTTAEALAKTCIYSPCPFAAHDELVSLMKSFEKSYNDGLRQFYLKGLDGLRDHTVGRADTDKCIRLSRVCFNVCSTIQPGPLRTFTLPAIKGEAASDGFWNRLSLAVFPDLPKYTDPIFSEKLPKLREHIKTALLRIDAFEAPLTSSDKENDNPSDPRMRLTFTADAQELWFQIRNETQRLVREDESIHPFLKSQMNKEDKILAGLACCFAIFDCVDFTEARPYSPPAHVTKEQLKLAIKWRDYLRAHFMRIIQNAYGSDDSDSVLGTIAREILKGIKKSGSNEPETELTVRLIRRKHWHGVFDNFSILEALETLADYHWLIKDETPRFGRGTDHFTVNPRVLKEQPKITSRIRPNPLLSEDEIESLAERSAIQNEQ